MSTKILLLSDEPLPESRLNESFFSDVDLIISCGDLPARYLSLIADISRKDVLYVHGNHDVHYLDEEPLGCICIDDKIFNWKGLTIMGLGGGHVYNGKPFQYTQREMKQRFLKLRLRSLFKKREPLDLLVTHSPAYGINDGKDPAHIGFQAFNIILDLYKPRFFIHGHVHLNYGSYPRIDRYGDTVIVNAFQNYLLEIADKSLSNK